MDSMPKLFVVLSRLCIIIVGTNTWIYAQVKEGDVVDKIVAVVGNEIVMKSEIDAQIFMLAQQSKTTDVSDPVLRKRILNALVNDRLIYNKALEDSTLQVKEEEVTQQLESTLQQMVAQVGSEKRLEEVYGQPIWKIRRDGREDLKKRMLMERLRSMKLNEVKVSRDDVEEFYKLYRDSLPDVGEQVELFHIVKNISPAAATKEKAQLRAKRIRDSVVAGGDFCDFAKRYSNDPGTASSCGELAMSKCTDFVAEFCSAAKKLQLNEYSLPVETPFGYHIIQLLDRTKEQIHTRHILIAVQRQDEDIESAKKQLTELKVRVEKSELSFEDAARTASDERETQGFGGSLGKTQLANLDGPLKAEISKLKDGGISEPIPYQTDRTKPSYHIVLRKRTITSHKPNLENDFKEIEKLANNFKQNKEYEQWLSALRTELHWEIRD